MTFWGGWILCCEKIPLWEIRCACYKKEGTAKFGIVVTERSWVSPYNKEMENGGVSKTKLRWRNYKMMEGEKRRWGKQGNGIVACNPVLWKDKGKSLMGGGQRLKKTKHVQGLIRCKGFFSLQLLTPSGTQFFIFPQWRHRLYHLKSIP